MLHELQGDHAFLLNTVTTLKKICGIEKWNVQHMNK